MLKGVFFLTRLCCPELKVTVGRILNLIFRADARHPPVFGAYFRMKVAVGCSVRYLRKSRAAAVYPVNTVAPRRPSRLTLWAVPVRDHQDLNKTCADMNGALGRVGGAG